MKINFICPYAGLSGGIRVISIFAEHLHRRGHDVFVVSIPKKKPGIKAQIRSLVKYKQLIRLPKHYSHFDSTNVQHKVLRTRRRIKASDIPDADVIVATWWNTAEDIALMPPEKGAKCYFIQLHEVDEALTKKEDVDRVKATYHLPFHKITVSPLLKDIMKHDYGDEYVSLVPNSVDTNQFHAPRRVKQKQPTVGLLYSPSPRKGCDIAFKAIEIARKRVPNLKVIAFGIQSPSPDLPLPLETKYFQQPEQNKIKDIYAQCDVWLCASRQEGFHLPPHEAMACRTPVVSTMVGGPVSLIEDGVNGYLVSIDDAEALGDKLVQVLLMNQNDWSAMSDAAFLTVSNYTWEDATELFEKALKTAITRSNNRAI